MASFAQQRRWTDLWLREQGFARVGPGQCVCRYCDQRLSTNALARASHVRSKRHQKAVVAAITRPFKALSDA